MFSLEPRKCNHMRAIPRLLVWKTCQHVNEKRNAIGLFGEGQPEGPFLRARAGGAEGHADLVLSRANCDCRPLLCTGIAEEHGEVVLHTALPLQKCSCLVPTILTWTGHNGAAIIPQAARPKGDGALSASMTRAGCTYPAIALTKGASTCRTTWGKVMVENRGVACVKIPRLRCIPEPIFCNEGGSHNEGGCFGNIPSGSVRRRVG